jgi:hypothetical protein
LPVKSAWRHSQRAKGDAERGQGQYTDLTFERFIISHGTFYSPFSATRAFRLKNLKFFNGFYVCNLAISIVTCEPLTCIKTSSLV